MFRSFAHTAHARFSIFLLCIFFLLCGRSLYAAEVVTSPSSGSYAVGQSFSVILQANPQGKSINAVEAKLKFDSTKLSVVSLSKTGSAFSLWTTEPTFSNSAGTIDFGGGSPAPFTARSNLLSVTFKVIGEGTGTFSVTSASILAADGLGTDVYTGAGNGTYTLTPPASTPTPPPATEDDVEEDKEEESDAAITFGDPPRAPEAGSTVFLDPEVWYATKSGLFTWEIPFDVDVLAMDMATSSEYDPETVYDPPIEQLSLSEDILVDGVQYLTMQYKNTVGWGAILHRKIMIDTIPPDPFDIVVRTGNSPSAFPLLTFLAQDTTSGIVKYELSIATGEPIDITPDEATLGYLLKDLEDGTYTVKVVAFDRAGNATESTKAILITAGWHPPVDVVVTGSIWDIFKGKNLVIILLLLGIAGQVAYASYMRKQHELREQKLRKETKEIQDQMEKIFSALRDEIYDQINMISKRDRLSKREKEAVEGLNQALEVSETLIEKEISDVSKILK